MLRSLRSRLLLTYVAVIAVVVVTAATFAALFLLHSPLIEQRQFMRMDLVARVIRRQVPSVQVAFSPLRWAEVTTSASELGVRVMVADGHGQVLRDTATQAPPLSPPRKSEGKPFRGRLRDAEGQTWLYTARRISGGLLVIATPMPSRWQWLLRHSGDWLLPMLESGLLAFGLALLLAWWLSRWIARPLRQVAAAAHDLAQGRYATLPEEGPAEARTLARAFNQMARQLEASQKSQRAFIANVSHELKTPLTSILGFAQALADGTALPAQAAGIIRSEAERMQRLVMDLLDLARLDAGTAHLQQVPIDLVPLLRAVLTRFQPRAAQRQQTLRLETAATPTVWGDPDRLLQIFGNLLDNALTHTPRQGEVVLRVRSEGPWAVVEVEDQGPGIPPEALPHIFDRFYRGDRARTGREHVGLGLSIVQELVRAHHGQVTAYNRRGQGAVFVVKLPQR